MKKGFTLIEILIVVIIVGILAGIAIPTFQGAIENNRARIAENNLRQIHTAERLRHIDTGAYVAATGLANINTALFLELAEEVVGVERYYNYEVVLTADGFTASADRIDGTRRLTINQDCEFDDSG